MKFSRIALAAALIGCGLFAARAASAEDIKLRTDWANALKDWPQQKAAELDKQGLPASQVLKAALEEAEKLGHKWPVRYQIK